MLRSLPVAHSDGTDSNAPTLIIKLHIHRIERNGPGITKIPRTGINRSSAACL